MASRKRKRGISAVLADVTNDSEVKSKRSSAVAASTMINIQSLREAPRGKHAPSSKPKLPDPPRRSPRMHSPPAPGTDTLCRLLKHRPEVILKGMEHLQLYIERNTTFVLQKVIALRIFAVAVSNGSSILEACSQASAFTNFSSEVVRTWAVACFRDFFSETPCIENISDEVLEIELSSNRGKHPKVKSLVHDEEFQLEAREYIRKNCYRKGSPNLTLSQFIQWVKEQKDIEICGETGRQWLHQLGFSYKQYSKGVYFDGHERPDVVEDRKKYLNTLTSHQSRMLTASHPTPDPESPWKPIIRVFHDESTFYANADQTFHWSDGNSQVLKQKSLGQAIMVSDFIEEVDGYLTHGDQSARLLLEHQSEGYFDNDMLIEQVKRAMDVFEAKYPQVQGMFIFDNAPSHCKKRDDALNADKMNISDGGKQPYMRDTVWRGRLQRMVLDNGQQKGMKRVLEERSVDTTGMNADKMRDTLKKFEDFKNQPTILEEVVTGRGHYCLYIPKFHCELNPIERCWCHAKRYSREYCNGTIVKLRSLVPEALATVSTETISKFFETCKDYERAYNENHTCHTVDEAVKKIKEIHKSHRKVY